MLQYQERTIQFTLYKHEGQDCKSTRQWPKSALIGVNGIFTTDINDTKTKPVISTFRSPNPCDLN